MNEYKKGAIGEILEGGKFPGMGDGREGGN